MTLNELIVLLESKAAGGLGERHVVFQAEAATAVLCLRLSALEESTRSEVVRKSAEGPKAILANNEVKSIFTVTQ